MHPNYDYDSIVDVLLTDKINVYEFLSDFVHFLKTTVSVSPITVKMYLTTAKSYFEYFDVSIATSKFRKRVKLPRVLVEDEQALETSEIRDILLGCSNKRLKTLLLILASGKIEQLKPLPSDEKIFLLILIRLGYIFVRSLIKLEEHRHLYFK